MFQNKAKESTKKERRDIEFPEWHVSIIGTKFKIVQEEPWQTTKGLSDYYVLIFAVFFKLVVYLLTASKKRLPPLKQLGW